MSDWPIVSLGDIARVDRGASWSKEQERSDGSGVPVIRIANVQPQGLDLSEVRSVVGLKQRDLERSLIGPATLLMVGSNGNPERVGNVYAATSPIMGASLASFVIGIHARGVVDARWLLCWLRSETVQRTLTEATAGSTGLKNLSLEWLRQLPVSDPPVAEKRRIVDLIRVFDSEIDALRAESLAAKDLYDNLLLLSMRLDVNGKDAVRLGDCMTLDVERVAVVSDSSYSLAGVLNTGKGLINRGLLMGSKTDYTHLNRLRAGQLVMRKLTAWEGPIAVVPDAFDGYCASNEFPTFSVDPNRLLPEYLGHLCRWPGLWHEMKQRVTGSVQRRKRLNPDQLLSVALTLPDVPTQETFAALLDSALEARFSTLSEAEALGDVRSAAISDLLSKVIEIPEAYDLLLVETS